MEKSTYLRYEFSHTDLQLKRNFHQNLSRILCRYRQADFKIYKEIKIVKAILKKNIVKGIALLDFKAYYMATKTKTVCGIRKGKAHRSM